MFWAFACSPTPGTQDETPTSQESVEETPAPGKEVGVSDAGTPEPTPDTATPQETVPEAKPIQWKQNQLQMQLGAGRPYELSLPEVEGGKAPYTYHINNSQLEGISLKDEKLHVRLSYKQKEELIFDVLVRDSEGKEASLSVRLTAYLPQWESILIDTGPVARANPAMAIAGKKVLVFGGYTEFSSVGSNELWVHDTQDKSWNLAEASGDIPPKAGVFRWGISQEGESGGPIVGVVAQAMSDINAYNDVYQFTLDTKEHKVVWKRMQSEGDIPQGLVLSAFGYDPKVGQFILFGGLHSSTGKISNELFLLTVDGTKAIWQKRSTPQAPPGRYGAVFATDPINGRFYVSTGTTDGGTPLTDLWVLSTRGADAWTWKEIRPTGKLIGRQNGAILLDVPGNRVFIWGGSAKGLGPQAITVVCLDDAEPRWEDIAPHPQLLSRTSIYSAIQPTTGESYVGFGRSPQFLRDLWVFRPNPPAP